MRDIFFINAAGKKFTYQHLLEDISGDKTCFSPYLHTTDTYSILKNMLIGLLANENVVLLDSSFTAKEIVDILGDADKVKEEKYINFSGLDLASLRQKVSTSKSSIGIFTSGTTGIPKRISHHPQVFTRSVRTGSKYADHRWGLAYNPTHMAGLQVFFQAFLNQCPIIDLFGQPNKIIVDRIKKYEVTHLSATPTFYRLLSSTTPITSVERVTLGGEKSDEKLYEKVKSIFPNAKINNIYATTEFGTLFVSDGSDFKITQENKDFIQLRNGVLWVHESRISKQNNNTIKLVDGWYCTNDKVAVISDEPLRFRFVSRTSSTINIGGYNVDPKETESVLLDFPGVKLARVFAKSNRILGNMLRAEVVAEENADLSEKAMLDFLKEKLQPHKLPRVIKIVDELKLTRTGKIKQ